MGRRVSPLSVDASVDISGDLLSGLGGNDGIEDSDGSDAGLGSFQDRSAHHLDLAAEDDDEDDDEAFIAATQAASNRKAPVAKTKAGKKGGGFQSMGLNPALLKSITRKGFTVPTPIQRKTIPIILNNDDVVGMARTGSGKTAAFAIPMIEKLKAHSVKVGVRAIILSPSRELALQTLKHVKELGKSTDLRSVLLVGGDSLEDQFSQMTTNPDIIIATPGRFCHLLAEMSLDLSSVRYVVFDEADRLFEMGFATQLHEILYALPPSRQTLLFSATLPKSLVEFAKAGLKDPRLVRLDAETKISPDLQSAFLTVKSADKEGALLHLLSDVIKMPLAESVTKADAPANPKKRKREQTAANGTMDPPTAHSTIIFAATKHHVDYLRSLMISAGYSVSYVYGSLDQTARKIQVDNFRNGSSTILVVTDVAARGIDIPLLANVVNYDFPAQPKVFVHRVGRTARAGRRGWSYSFVQDADLPYFLDLQLFLGRATVKGRAGFKPTSFAEDLVIGAIPRTGLEPACEYVTKLLGDDEDLAAQRTVAAKGEKLYLRTRNSASAESAKRTKTFTADPHAHEANPVYGDEEHSTAMAGQRDDLLAKISGFKPAETVFEIGKRGVTTEVGEALERQRKRMRAKQPRNKDETAGTRDARTAGGSTALPDDENINHENNASEMGVEDDTSSERDVDDITDSDTASPQPAARRSWQDRDNFMSYAPRDSNAVEERGYGVKSGSNFVDAARGATLDLQADETRSFAEPSKMRWDKRSKKYVARANDEDGSKGARKVMGESGQKIAASFRSGRFDAWRKANRVERMPRTGEQEARGGAGGGSVAAGIGKGRRFKHYAERAPKRPDIYRDDYQQQKKKYNEARARTEGTGGKGELRGVDEVRKQRQLKQKRREKNARPSKKAKGKRRM